MSARPAAATSLTPGPAIAPFAAGGKTRSPAATGAVSRCAAGASTGARPEPAAVPPCPLPATVRWSPTWRAKGVGRAGAQWQPPSASLIASRTLALRGARTAGGAAGLSLNAASAAVGSAGGAAATTGPGAASSAGNAPHSGWSREAGRACHSRLPPGSGPAQPRQSGHCSRWPSRRAPRTAGSTGGGFRAALAPPLPPASAARPPFHRTR